MVHVCVTKVAGPVQQAFFCKETGKVSAPRPPGVYLPEPKGKDRTRSWGRAGLPAGENLNKRQLPLGKRGDRGTLPQNTRRLAKERTYGPCRIVLASHRKTRGTQDLCMAKGVQSVSYTLTSSNYNRHQ